MVEKRQNRLAMLRGGQVGIMTAKVFISYSRRDSSDFAENLFTGLELLGFEPFLDRRAIAAGEDWESRLAALILASDTVVFVISPEAVRSERCAWEVGKSVALGKRLIPILAKPTSDGEIPHALNRLNYISFTNASTFSRALGELADALRMDLDWIREHTRVGEQVVRWLERGRPEALLLRGPELEAAQHWLATWKAGLPDPSDAQRLLIATSADAEAARNSEQRRQLDAMAVALSEREKAVRTLSRRTTVGVMTASILTAGAAGLAYWGLDAERRFRRQRAMAEDAERRSIDENIRQEAARTDIEGQLSAFAASPGRLADDGGAGENSPYTKAVLAALADRNVSLQAGLARARLRVLATSRTQQSPYLSTDLNGDLYLQRQSPERQRTAIVASVDTFAVGKSADDVAFAMLENVERDAIAWERFLRDACGFIVTRLKNPTLTAFHETLQKHTFAPRQRSDRPAGLLHRVGIRLARISHTAS